MTPKKKSPSFIVVTGLSGAGKTTAMAALKDLGFQTIDNLPFEMLDSFVSYIRNIKNQGSPIALGFDAGDSQFINNYLNLIDDFKTTHPFELVFLKCKKAILLKRFSETRRKHPLANNMSINEVVSLEIEKLKKLGKKADRIIDTSNLSVHQLKKQINNIYGHAVKKDPALHIEVMSFGYRYGVPESANLVFDIRFLANPYFVPELRNYTGLDDNVYNFVVKSEEFPPLLDKVNDLIEYVVPLYEKEGKHYLTIAFGCTGGKHRSVSMARKTATILKKSKYSVNVTHRDIGID